MARQYICKKCGLSGHNARTCGRAVSGVKARPVAKQAKSQPKTDPEVQSNNGSWRKCSYCYGRGHTSKTCLEYFRDRKEYLSLIEGRFNGIVEHLNNNIKISPGCIIEIPYNFNSSWRLTSDIEIFQKLFPGNPELLQLVNDYAKEKVEYNFCNIRYTIKFLVASPLENSLIIDNRNHINHFSLVIDRIIFCGLDTESNKTEESNKYPATHALCTWLLNKEVELLSQEYKKYNYSFNMLSSNISTLFRTNAYHEIPFDSPTETTTVVSQNLDKVHVNYDISKTLTKAKNQSDISKCTRSSSKRGFAHNLKMRIRTIKNPTNY